MQRKELLEKTQELHREIFDLREQIKTEWDRISRFTCAVERVANAVNILARPRRGNPMDELVQMLAEIIEDMKVLLDRRTILARAQSCRIYFPRLPTIPGKESRQSS